MEVCRYVYDPTHQSKFVVYFDEDEKHPQKVRAERAVKHLRTLDETELQEESIKFFKWLVLHPLSSLNEVYAAELLAFFHSKDKLMFKRTVHNPRKQAKARYLVVYTLTGATEHVFARTYNSIREIKVDTGRKPSQIKRLATKEIMCKALAESGS